MYLEHLHIQNFKLIGDMQLSFLNAEDFEDADGTQHKKGEPRMFTVLIGKNARGKTSVLQAIALAVSKETTANLLIQNHFAPFKKLKTNHPLDITACISIDKEKKALTTITLNNNSIEKIDYPTSKTKNEGRFVKENIEKYSQQKLSNLIKKSIELNFNIAEDKESKEFIEQMTLYILNSKNKSELSQIIGHTPSLVTSYGTHRTLPHPSQIFVEDPPLNRLQPLFSPTHQINGTNFIEHLRAVDRTPDKAMSRGYLKILEDLLSSDLGLLPEVKALRARGTGEIPEEDYLALEHRVVTTIGGHEIEVPTTWLSQGYQAMFSWIADMIGWACLEQKRAVPPAEIEGIALIDEIDLFLHPTWQVRLIPTLKKLFPKVQFIVTTHSPLVLSSLRPDEIVVLELDDETGELVAHNGPGQVPDPRLRTMGELASEFFEIHRLYPQSLAAKHDEYTTIAVNAARSPEQTARALTLQAEFDRMGIQYIPMVPTEQVPSLDDWFKEDEQGG